MDTVKREIIHKAVGMGANLLIPETASDVKKVKAFIQMLLANSYTVHFVCVLASKACCQERGFSREHIEGKKYSSSNYASSVNAIHDVAHHFFTLQPSAVPVVYVQSRLRPVESCIDNLVDWETVEAPGLMGTPLVQTLQ